MASYDTDLSLTIVELSGTYKLKEDIKNRLKNEFYAKKGEKVEIVSDMGKVVIVELKGNRFSVNKEKLEL
jgi:hypothetical protein